MNYRQACQPGQRLSKNNLLAILPSKINKDKGIIVSTGEVINLVGIPQTTINNYLNDNTMVYFEELMPRRMLLTQPNWTVKSFSPDSTLVCVQIFTNSGMRMLNFTLSQYVAKPNN